MCQTNIFPSHERIILNACLVIDTLLFRSILRNRYLVKLNPRTAYILLTIPLSVTQVKSRQKMTNRSVFFNAKQRPFNPFSHSLFLGLEVNFFSCVI